MGWDGLDGYRLLPRTCWYRSLAAAVHMGWDQHVLFPVFHFRKHPRNQEKMRSFFTYMMVGKKDIIALFPFSEASSSYQIVSKACVRFLYIYKAKKCFFPACICQSIEQLKISGEEKASFSRNIQQIKNRSLAYFCSDGT